MRCPFLREAQVKYCQSSTIKKMIVRSSGESTNERCSSGEYVNCPSLKQHREDNPHQTRCPFLQESLVQYCSALPVTKYIPYSESSIIRCGNDGYRYCELFLSVASTNDVGASDGTEKVTMVKDIRLPESLSYSANHMWLDQTDDGMCHVGVDEFLAKFFYRIDAINFLSSDDLKQPTVVLTANGVDLKLAFPISINVTGTNAYLRVNPKKLVSHPYSAGWLFEGRLTESNQVVTAASTLMRGVEAMSWMKNEIQHLNEFVHSQIIPNHNNDHPTMMDGGVVHPEIIDHLNKQELLQLFNEFFPPYAGRRKTS
jgi:glycine cleavage system H lipoate-binding protein